MSSEVTIRNVEQNGRVVIPRNIRKKLGLHEGTPLEVRLTESGEIILKKVNDNLDDIFVD